MFSSSRRCPVVVLHEQILGFPAESSIPCRFGTEPGYEMLHEGGDSSFLPKGRNGHEDYIEAVKQSSRNAPSLTRLSRLRLVALMIRTSDRSVWFPPRRWNSLLEKTEQLDLDRRRELPHLDQEEGPPSAPRTVRCVAPRPP
jgi:hypothetical protein